MRTAQELREHVASLPDDELEAMLERCLSTRLRRIAEAEAERRAGA